MLGVLLGSTLCLAAAASPPTVEVHGWSLTRYYVDTAVNATRDPDTGEISDVDKDSFLEEERISLYALARLPEGRLAYGEVYIHPWLPASDPTYLYLESLYVDFPVSPTAKVRIGKGRNQAFGIVPTYGARKFSNYSPVAEVYTQDRVLGIQYLQTCGPDTLNFAVINSPRVGRRFLGMTADEQLESGGLGSTTVPHLVEKDIPNDRSQGIEGTARWGRQFNPQFNAGVSARLGSLDDTDIDFLKSKYPDQVSGQTRVNYGVDATWVSRPFVAEAEYYAGTTGGIDNTGWDILVGFEPTKQCALPWRSYSSACKGLFARYSVTTVDAVKTLDPMTWDTNQLALSYVYPFKFKGQLSAKWLQFEYEMNHESPPEGVDEIPNNIFFVELFSAF
jgi:hypothetical protein